MQTLTDAFGWLFDPANWSGSNGIPVRTWEHVLVSLVALLIAATIAVPLGLAIGHTGRGRFISVQLANIGRAVPSLAILALAFLIVLELWRELAFGFLPAVVALTALGIPVILINTYVGVDQVDAHTVEAARGMGMSGGQVLARLEVPLAMPLIMTGLRLAAVQIVATAGLAALVAGGGYGRYVIDCFYLREFDCMIGGVILIAVLSVLTDVAFSLLARVTAPRLHSEVRAPAAATAPEPRPSDVTPS